MLIIVILLLSASNMLMLREMRRHRLWLLTLTEATRQGFGAIVEEWSR